MYLSTVHAPASERPLGPVSARADASEMERVFLNLLDNAARFSPPVRPSA